VPSADYPLDEVTLRAFRRFMMPVKDQDADLKLDERMTIEVVESHLVRCWNLEDFIHAVDNDAKTATDPMYAKVMATVRDKASKYLASLEDGR
jgi:hypothetical protein